MLPQHEDMYRDGASTGLSPELASYGWASTSQQYSLPPQVSHHLNRDSLPDSSFYQPRHSIPFHSHDNAETGQGIFAYNAPLQPAAMQTTLTPSPLYESQFTNPAYLQDHPALPRFIPPPPSYSQGRAYVHAQQTGSASTYNIPTYRDQNQYSPVSGGGSHEYGIASHTNYSSTSLRTFPPPSYPEESIEQNHTPSLSLASPTEEDNPSEMNGLGLQDLHRDDHTEDQSRPRSENEVDVDSLSPAPREGTEDGHGASQQQKRARGSSVSEKGGLDEPNSASPTKRQPKEFLLWPGAGAAWHPTRGSQYVEARSE